jgi:hypothetical protein
LDKAKWVEKMIDQKGYDDIYFADDSEKNIVAVKKRLRDYPNVKQKIQHIKHF